MKGDFSRSTFRRIKHYRKVKLQQGRVQVDADWNEQVDIQAYYDQMSLRDIIGSSGAPADDAGFLISQSSPGSYRIGAGRYYVNGLLVENEKDFEVPLSAPGKYLAYLKVWEQGVTALDDPEIRESALGGPDTSVRSKIAWQVLFHSLKEDVDKEWENLITQSLRSTGTLAARSRHEEGITDACMLPPGAGYRRLENQLYRVEVHDSGQDGRGATFKWSRDNGSVMAAVTKISGSELTVSSVGRDGHALAFREDQWIEVTDESRELAGKPGTLAKITDVREETQTLVIAQPIGDPITEINYPSRYRPKVIRWDSAGKMAIPTFDGAPDRGYIHLEDGLEVKFGAGSYRTGDYWLIPARTVKGDIEWPSSSGPEALAPEGIIHHYCRLAVLDFNKRQVTDLRQIFPSINTLTTMQYVGGNGQRGAPRTLLPTPLMVGVSRGGTPLEGVRVRFEVKVGEGAVFAEKPPTGRSVDPATNRQAIALTDRSGIALCYWQLDYISNNQIVEAALLDSTGKTMHLPVVFNAIMEHSAPPLGLRVKSGLIKEKIATETYKIAGPFYHDVDAIKESTAPPSILLGETNVDRTNVNIAETVRQMEDLTLMSILNKQYGVPREYSDKDLSKSQGLGLDDLLDRDDPTPPVPILFKPVSVDMEKFFVLLVNYNKSPTQIAWDEWRTLAGLRAGQVAAGRNKDGRLEVFAIGTDGTVHRILQPVPNADWVGLGGWTPIAGQKLKEIAVANNNDGHLHLFGVNDSDMLVHTWQDATGNWNKSWEDINIKVKQIAVGRNADGRLELFGIGANDIPGHTWQENGPEDMSNWTDWFPMRGIKAKKLAVGRNADGRLELFAVGYKDEGIDRTMLIAQYTGGDLFRIASAVRKGSAFVMKGKIDEGGFAKGVEKRDVFTRREVERRVVDAAVKEKIYKEIEATQPAKPPQQEAAKPAPLPDTVFHAWQSRPNGDWSPWYQLGNQQATQVAAARNADGRLEVFVIGSDKALYHIWQTAPNNGWSGWASLGGNFTDVAAASNADDRIEVFAVAPRLNLILSTGALLNTKLVADRLASVSLPALETAKRVRAATITDVLKTEIKETAPEIKSMDVAKFRELALLRKIPARDVTAGNTLYHIWQTAPNNGWSGWASLGGNVRDITIADNADGRLSVFATSFDDSDVNVTSQIRVENEVSLRWWAIPAVDVYTRDTQRASGTTEGGGPDDKEAAVRASVEKAAAERAAAEKAAAEKATTERAAAERAAAERVAAEKAAAERAAMAKAAAEKAAAERAAAERAAGEKAAAERAAAERAAAERTAAAKAAAAKAAAEREEAERVAAEKAAAERARVERAAAERAAAERAAIERAAAERAAAEKAAAERAAAERAAAEKVAAERAAAERAAAERAAAERAAATTVTARPIFTAAIPVTRVIATPVNPRCAEIKQELAELQERVRDPALTPLSKAPLVNKIRILQAEKANLKCPD
jgi:hypothetical protein